MARLMNLVLNVWRQKSPKEPGAFVRYEAKAINDHMSFLEMLDVVNEGLAQKGEAPIAFDHDCREGICGACGMVINGVPHGPAKSTTTCQLHMRSFNDGDEITIEPWRAAAFPVVRDLVVDRGAFDPRDPSRRLHFGTRGRSARSQLLARAQAGLGRGLRGRGVHRCGACVAACPNASAALFAAAKISHLALLPQGAPERADRVRKMVAQMDAEGFGHCSSHKECEAVCPKDISISFIAKMNRELLSAMAAAPNQVKGREKG